MKNYTNIIIGILITAGMLLLFYYFRSIVFYLAISSILALLGEPIVSALKGVKIKKITINRT